MADEEKRSEEEAAAAEAGADAGAPADGDAALAAQAAPEPASDAADTAAVEKTPDETSREAVEGAAADATPEAAKDSEPAPLTAKSPEAESIAGHVAARSADTTDTGVHPLAGDPPHGTEGVHDHGHGHVAPMTMLLGVLGALIILTVMTVAVTMVDLGGQGNFVVAMAIATVKAALVMGYFMHLVWDSKFNVVVFLSSFLFVILFLSMALLDRQEYQHGIDEFAKAQALTAK